MAIGPGRASMVRYISARRSLPLLRLHEDLGADDGQNKRLDFAGTDSLQEGTDGGGLCGGVGFYRVDERIAVEVNSLSP